MIVSTQSDTIPLLKMILIPSQLVIVMPIYSFQHDWSKPVIIMRSRIESVNALWPLMPGQSQPESCTSAKARLAESVETRVL
jgi:hypothetical protein